MIKTINATTLKSLLDTREVILVDVREADEFRAEHIGAALSFPLSTLHNHMSQLDFPAGSKIVFQCLGGVRSNNACLMVESGLSEKYDIYNLEGGLNAWKKAGLPLISTASTPTDGSSCCSTPVRGTPSPSIFRQVQIIAGSLIFFCVALGFLITSSFFVLAGIFGGMLAFAGYTGWCGLAMLLQRAPWNK